MKARLAKAVRAEIDVNYICPRRCIFCCNSALLKSEARMGLPKFIAVVESMPKLSRADLSGGEPYCEPKLPEMIAYLAGRGIRCDVSTGGTVWREDVAEAGKRAMEKGLFSMQVSIPALSESVYDSVTRTKGNLDALLGNVGRFAEAFGKSLRLRMTLCRENMGEIGGLAGLAKQYNLLLQVEPMMLVGENAATPLGKEELSGVKFYIGALRHGGARMQFEFSEDGDGCPVFAKTYGLPMEGKGCAKPRAYIDAYGNAAVCTFLKYRNGVLSCK